MYPVTKFHQIYNLSPSQNIVITNLKDVLLIQIATHKDEWSKFSIYGYFLTILEIYFTPSTSRIFFKTYWLFGYL